MNRAPLILGAALIIGLAGCSKKTENATAPAAANTTVEAGNAAAANAAAPAAGNAIAAVDVSSWSGLEAAVGKYPQDVKLFETSVVVAPLKTLLKDDYDDFVENMQVAGPISKDKVLFVTGNKPHQGGSDAAYLIADPTTQKFEVGLWDDGKFKSFSSPGALLTRPADVRTMISNMREAAKTGG